MNKDANSRIQGLLIDLWRSHLPRLHERLDLLDRAATEAAEGDLSVPMRLEALSIAHKLVGSLGMFGHHEASKIASQMEQILEAPATETLVTFTTLARALRASLAPDL